MGQCLPGQTTVLECVGSMHLLIAGIFSFAMCGCCAHSTMLAVECPAERSFSDGYWSELDISRSRMHVKTNPVPSLADQAAGIERLFDTCAHLLCTHHFDVA